MFKGLKYEYEQTDFRGNHTAVVDAARCGRECRIADSAPSHEHKEQTMVTRTFDGLTVTLENEQSGQVVDRIVRDLAAANKQVTELKAATPTVPVGDKQLDAAGVAAVIAAKDAEIKTLKDGQQTPAQVHALVVLRSNAITQAKDMAPELKIGDADTAHAIHIAALDDVQGKDETAKAMLDAALGGVKLADAPEATVAVAFNTISAGLKRARDARKTTQSRSEVARLATTQDNNGEDPRSAWLKSQGDAWKGDAAKSKTEVN
jgi:hypothetical protein